MPTVLVSAPYIIAPLERFRPALEGLGVDLVIAEVEERLGEEDLMRRAGSFDGAICGDDPYTSKVLEACRPRLRVISKWGTGIDSIDAAACARMGIKLYRTTNAFTTPVADTVLGYLLAFARRQPWMDRDMKAGRWSKEPGHSLSEAILGIVGLGHIGKAVARRARSFGMHILGNDIIDVDHVFLTETGVEMTDLAALLSRSDYISINCDLNPTSHHLLDTRAFGLMKPNAVVINTARGPIIDEGELVTALQAGRIGGAALDVFENEPLPAGSRLRGLDNVLLAPHNSNSSPAAWERVHRSTIRNLLEGLGMQRDVRLGD